MRGFLLISLFVFLSFLLKAQSNTICVLDLSKKNAETTKGNLFSLEHLLKSGGFSYSITDSVNIAIRNNILLTTGNLETITFNTTERDSIKQFVRKGGILISTNNKDNNLDSIFGISSTLFNYTRFYMNFKTAYDANGIFKLFDEPEEKQIRFGDTADYTTTIGTRAFTCSTADTLALYETNEVGATHNKFYSGHTYMIGTQYKEIILRPQIKQDYAASRKFSNGFEPAQDVYTFLISGIIRKHLPYIVSKHSSPCNFKSALVLTHDVDATTSIGMIRDYASYEKSNNISGTYLVTTHYMHDKIAKNFFDGYEDDITYVFEKGHDIQSHSVSHVPDFDIQSIVGLGNLGNNRNSYQPYYDGSVSSNVTVLGETEVSRDLLKGIINKNITAFRPGYLLFHKDLITALDTLGYKFSTGHSACDVMTNFPYFSHTDLSMSGRLTKVLEIPNHISDVFSSDPINEDNYLDKVSIWKSSFTKVYNNNLSSVLLIHPNRYYKLYAEQLVTASLPQDAVVLNLSDYGNYWLNRDAVTFTTVINVDTLNLYLSKPKDSLNTFLSFVIANGQDFSKIKVYSSDAFVVNYTKSNWQTNDVILHNNCNRPNYNAYSITEEPLPNNIHIYPNPSEQNNAMLHFDIMEQAEITADIYDSKGALVYNLINDIYFNGTYDIPLPAEILSSGTYLFRLKIGTLHYKLKWVLTKSK